MDTDVGPSDEEGGKEAKRQKSEPTTPISTSSRPPNEYDEVMGITQVDPREAERFEDGVEPEFQDVEEELPNETETNLDLGAHGSGVSHGGFGRSSLQECLDRLNKPELMPLLPATLGLGMNVYRTRRKHIHDRRHEHWAPNDSKFDEAMKMIIGKKSDPVCSTMAENEQAGMMQKMTMNMMKGMNMITTKCTVMMRLMRTMPHKHTHTCLVKLDRRSNRCTGSRVCWQFP